MNTFADSLEIPIVGSEGENWQQDALKRLNNGANDRVVIPEYGGSPNITKPHK
jgi:hypothetical protein